MGKYVSTRAVKRDQLDHAVHLTGYNAIYGHARFVKALRSTCGFKPIWAAYEPLEYPKVALDGLMTEVTGAVAIKWARNEQSCLITFGPILAKHEWLGVRVGRIRLIGFTVVDGRLILNIIDGKVDDSEPRKRRMAARARWERMSRAEQQAAIDKAMAKMMRKTRERFEALARKQQK